MKYNKKIVKHIFDLIAKDSYTIAEICASVGISERCYYTWQEENAEFAEGIKKAREKYDETLVKEAKRSLIKLVKGYDVEETKVVYTEGKDGKPKVKEKTSIKKHFQPSVPATIFMLTNKAPEEYKNRQTSELTGKGGKDLIPARVLSKKEMQELLTELDNEC